MEDQPTAEGRPPPGAAHPGRAGAAGTVAGVTATEASSLRSLDPRAVTLWRLTAAARGVLGLASLVAVGILVDIGLPAWVQAAALIASLAAVAAAVLGLPPLRYRAWGFALRDDHVHLRHGVLFRTTSIVPYARIQHVDTRHGPIDRWLGLASLVVFTAGTRGAILTIPALEAAEAESLRDRLAALSGAGDAV